MIINNEPNCPDCSGDLRCYDIVDRTVRTKNGTIKKIKVRRYQCKKCKRVHRRLPSNLYPYRQYEAGIINGFISGELDSCCLEFEDYPCESTIKNWFECFPLASN